MYTNTNKTMGKCPDFRVGPSCLSRCTDYFTVCMLILMEPWTGVESLKVCTLHKWDYGQVPRCTHLLRYVMMNLLATFGGGLVYSGVELPTAPCGG